MTRIGEIMASGSRNVIVAVANQKGGVGKTTTTVALAYNLHRLGHRVLVIDIDPQANTTATLGCEPDDVVESSMFSYFEGGNPNRLWDIIRETDSGVWLAPSHLGLAHTEHSMYARSSPETFLARGIGPERERFDVILIDCPPSLGMWTYNALAACDTVLAPIQAEPYALDGLTMLLSTIDAVRNYEVNGRCHLGGAVLTLVDRRRNVDRRTADMLREALGPRAFETVIPRDVRIVEMAETGELGFLAGESNAAVAYRELAREVSDRWLKV